MDTRALEDLIKRVSAIDETQIEIGFFDRDHYGPENSNLSVAMVAFLNEYGHSLGPQGVPQRPFMHDTFEDRNNHLHISRSMSKIFQKVITTKRGIQGDLRRLGVMVSDMMKVAIDDYPGNNSPITIKRKGFDDPLYDTGRMLRSVRFQIQKGDNIDA